MFRIGNTEISFSQSTETIGLMTNGKPTTHCVPVMWAKSTMFTSRGKAIKHLMCSAYCSPKDKFDAKKGRKIALTRLLKKMGISRGRRTLAWKNYKRFMHSLGE